MDWQTTLLFFLGLGLLVFGADWLVKGASRLAAAAGVSPLVVGLTVVAFGTSAPELAVSVQAAWAGKADMAVANVVGSNICNVLLILGVSAIITPLAVAQQLVRRDVPIVIGLSVGLWAIARDGELTWVDGVLLVLGLVGYTAWLIRMSRRESKAVEAEYEAEFGVAEKERVPVLASIGLVLGGLAGLVIGGKWLVDGAVSFATWCGVSEVVVGLTVVAVGTSMPELATSIVAAMKGERDIAVGNVVGSNIFNIMGVIGVSSIAAPSGLLVKDSMVGLDIPVMIATAVACLPIFARGFTIPRWQGFLFLAFYAAYTVYLVLDAKEHESRHDYGRVMLQFVIPLTALTLGIVAFRVLRKNGSAAG